MNSNLNNGAMMTAQSTFRSSTRVRKSLVLMMTCAIAAAACKGETKPAAAPVTANTAIRSNDSVPTGTDAQADSMLVDVQSLDPTIEVDMRYRNADNFTGAPIAGYEGNHAFMRGEAAAALARVQASLKSQGLTLLVWDSYRPVRATNAMVAWTQKVHREDLVRDGYISDRSKHNLGVAIDLTLVNTATKQQLDMGTKHDSFAAEAHTANATGLVAENRKKLVDAMSAQGFTNYDQEWWHFSFDVPNPIRFDRPIR
ncbi:MAG: M15 family metallopeptidase [Gemmatimonadaceae bacterium]